MRYAFIVEYKKAKDNLVANALSKKDGEEGASFNACTLYIISFLTPTWIAKLKDSYESDPNLYQLLQAFKPKEGGGEFPKGLHCKMDSYYTRVESIWGLIAISNLLSCTMCTTVL